MFPVRCYTCDTVIGQQWFSYTKRLRNGESTKQILEDLQCSRMCCRRMFLSHVDLMPEQVKFPCVDVTLDESGTLLRRKVHRERTVVCD